MTLIRDFNQFYTKPMNEAMPAIIGAKTGCFQSIKARLLLVAQLIIAIVAIPFLVLGGAFVSRFCQKDQKTGLDDWYQSVKRLFVVVIPASFVGIFAPLSTTEKCIHSLERCKCCCDEDSGVSRQPDRYELERQAQWRVNHQRQVQERVNELLRQLEH